MDSTIYFEVLVLINILLRDIFGDHVVCHVAGTAAEIASCPQMPSPKLFLQVRKLGEQVVRCPPFQPLQQQQVIALGQLGWSLRRIEATVHIRRETIRGYLRSAGIGIRPRGGWGLPAPVKPANYLITDFGGESADQNVVVDATLKPSGRIWSMTSGDRHYRKFAW